MGRLGGKLLLGINTPAEESGWMGKFLFEAYTFPNTTLGQGRVGKFLLETETPDAKKWMGKFFFEAYTFPNATLGQGRVGKLLLGAKTPR